VRVYTLAAPSRNVMDVVSLAFQQYFASAAESDRRPPIPCLPTPTVQCDFWLHVFFNFSYNFCSAVFQMITFRRGKQIHAIK